MCKACRKFFSPISMDIHFYAEILAFIHFRSIVYSQSSLDNYAGRGGGSHALPPLYETLPYSLDHFTCQYTCMWTT